jgi:hypothetical protein
MEALRFKFEISCPRKLRNIQNKKFRITLQFFTDVGF